MMPPGSTKPTALDVELGKVRALLAPIAEAHGVELVDVEWTTGPQGRILRVFIERAAAAAAQPTGGVTLEDCVRVSRDASNVLDVSEVVSCHYHLEVSSPGADRPLRSLADFARQVGRVAKVKLATPAADGQRVLRGVVLEAGDARVRMDVDGNVHEVALSDVVEARPVVEIGRAPSGRGGPPRKTNPRGGQAAKGSGRSAPRAGKPDSNGRTRSGSSKGS
jgi:ribosome maturation factor RimP